MLVRDQKRMAAMGSPLRRVFAGLPDDAEARDWFEATYSHSLEERSERFRGRDEFRRLVESTLGSLADTPLLDGLAEEELHEVRSRSCWCLMGFVWLGSSSAIPSSATS